MDADLRFWLIILASAVLISGLMALLGAFVSCNRVNYLSSSLAHASLGGIGLGLFLGLPLFAFSQLFVLILAFIVAFQFYRDRDQLNSYLDLIYAFGMSLGSLLIALSPGYQKDFSSYLFGSFLLLNADNLLLLSLFAILVGVYFFTNYHKLVAASFDPDFSYIAGINVKRQQLLFMLMLVLVITTAVRLIGITSVIALLSAGPLLLGSLAASMSQIIAGAFLFNLIVFSCGIGLSFLYDLPTGSAISLSAIGLFLISKLFLLSLNQLRY